jgi:hypothetical protein
VLDLQVAQAPAAGPSLPTGPWAPFAAVAQAALSSAALAHAPQAAPPATGGGPLPQVPDPAPAGGSASGGIGSGVGFGFFLALLFSIAAFALRHYSRLRLPPAQWRQFTFVAVIERPG